MIFARKIFELQIWTQNGQLKKDFVNSKIR